MNDILHLMRYKLYTFWNPSDGPEDEEELKYSRNYMQ